MEPNNVKTTVIEPMISKTTKDNSFLHGEVLSCTDSSEGECFRRLLFATNRVHAPGFMRIKKGFLLFLLNMDSEKLYGGFRATSDSRFMIEPEAWEGKYPYQAKVEPVHDIVCLGC